MNGWTLAGLVVAAVALAGPAAAHQKAYVNVTGDRFIVPLDCDGDLGISQGGVCYPAGHIQADNQGLAILQITDFVTNPTSGCYQQDTGLPCQPFCAQKMLKEGINWFPERRVEVFIDGPLFGNFVTSPCGFLKWSQGFAGRVSHH